MFGPILGAITGIIGALMQGSAQQQQNAINWQALQEQKRNARDQFDLATATTIDAQGNKLEYDPFTHERRTILTPDQQAIMNALQGEQKATYTEDMPRARRQREMQEARGKEANKLYGDLFAQYKNKPPASEGAYQDELIKDALFAQQDKLRQGGDKLATLAVRSGQDPSALSSIVKSVADQQGAGAMDAVIAGKQAGTGAHKQAMDIYHSQLDPLKLFASISDDVGGFTPERSTTAADTMQMQKDMESAISQALANASNQVGGAYRTLASGAGQSPSLDSIASALSGLKMDSGDSFSAPVTGGSGASGMPGVSAGGTGLGINGGMNIWDPYGSGGSGYSVKDRTTGGYNSDYEDPFSKLKFTWP